ncbi:hypothetical protein AB0I84_18830 [Streptomyces spectabilis]|uniref:hypothetical protein n=1 Tax=Streptomyces spectabilis TaxID=68270 RepID=UPI00340B5F42
MSGTEYAYAPFAPAEARTIQAGDVFILHGYKRTSLDGAWGAHPGHVTITFEGGGYAIVSALKLLDVRRRAQ